MSPLDDFYNLPHAQVPLNPCQCPLSNSVPRGAGVRAILDRHGKRCGLWWKQAGYVYLGRGLSPEAEAKMILGGLGTQPGESIRSMLEPQSPEWEPITVFNTEVYGESGLVNVLAAELDMGHEYG
ncbi:hypothetical protein B0H66DRAFT_565651, partial [Apodospora peruviana]